jgi:glycosyltransferase involved in cell wall biosynthesis
VKLSVMMITYNHEKFLAQALTSILAQQVNFDYEIVVGEDCSTDGTRDVLMRMHAKHPGRIIPLLPEKNLGALPNMAATLAACRGTYVAFLEGDDYWTDNQKLQRQVEFLDANPGFAMCCHRVKLLDPKRREGIAIYPEIAAGAYRLEDLLKENFIPSCSAVVRRELIGKVPSWHSTLAMGDWTLFALVSSHGAIELMDEIMATYRVHVGGIWSSRSRESRLVEVSRMLQVLDSHFDFKYANVIKPALAKNYFELAVLKRDEGSRLGVVKNALACIRAGGWGTYFRAIGGLFAYALIGPSYRRFSRAKSAQIHPG